MRALRRLSVLALLGLWLSCDADRGFGRDHTDAAGGALRVTPEEAVLTVDGKSPAQVSFQVSRMGEDVTSQATFTVESSWMGSFQGNTFTSFPGAAGRTRVVAQVGEDTGRATLILRVKAVVIEKDAPPDAPDRFAGPDDPTRAPELAYPPDRALIPPNLNELEVHFTKAAASLFEVSFLGDGIDLRVYTRCRSVGLGCGYTPAEETWKLLSQAARGGTVKIKVRGTADDGGGVGTSAENDLSFGDDDIKGGIYYWAASAGGIFRYDFGLRGQKAENFYSPGQAGLVTCVGCHALSRNGKRIAVGLNIPQPAQMRVLDVATRKKTFEIGGGIPGMAGSDYQAFTSDGEKIIAVEKGGLTLHDATSGGLLSAMPAIENANMPDISPDDRTVVFARGGPGCILGLLCITLSVQNASLFTVSFDASANTFGTPQPLVQSAGENNYYPSFSPDGKFVVFNRSSGDSFDSPTARVMVISSQGGSPIDLGTVNKEVGNSWPKWSPFIQRFQGRTIFWITFSSRRTIGLRTGSAAQIWMVPVDPKKLAAGEDPGFPPFWLPFQDPTTGNHIAQWVEKVERAPCTPLDSSGCLPTEMCVNGVCVPGVK